MGVTNCSRHGRTGIRLTCPHGVIGLATGKMPVRMICLVFKLGDFLRFPEMPVQIGTQYCLDCAEKYGLPVEDSQRSAEDFDTMPIDDVSIPVCGKCYAEAMANRSA
jgi:hypothetical protein